MSYSEHSEAYAFWRSDDSGHDACSIEQDWQSEKQRVMRGLDGHAFLHEVLAEQDQTMLDALASMSKEGNEEGVGLMICAMVKKYIDDQTDLSVFGKITRRK